MHLVLVHVQTGASWMDMMALTGLAGGMVAGSYCLWYYSRRWAARQHSIHVLLVSQEYR
jgi:hypothetical protein